jgi:hypothetical protein
VKEGETAGKRGRQVGEDVQQKIAGRPAVGWQSGWEVGGVMAARSMARALGQAGGRAALACLHVMLPARERGGRGTDNQKTLRALCSNGAEARDWEGTYIGKSCNSMRAI